MYLFYIENIIYIIFFSVDSNNGLYGGADTFIADTNSVASGALNDLLVTLKLLGDEMQVKKQVRRSFDNNSWNVCQMMV